MTAKDRHCGRLAAVAFVFAAVALASSGCAAARYEAVTPLDDNRLAAELNARLEAARRVAFAAVHRTVLTASGRDFILTGYVRGNRAGDIRLQAGGDLGATAFDVESPAAGSARAISTPQGMRRAWLEQGAARDLAVMYRLRPATDARLVRFHDGEIGFVEEKGPRERREFRFDAATHCFAGYSVVKYRRRVYEARFSDVGFLENWPQRLARRASITDGELGYSLDIRVIEMRPEAGE